MVDLSAALSPYRIYTFLLDSARNDEEVNRKGDYLAFSTDGDMSGISVKIGDRNFESISLLNFNNLSGAFERFYLTNTAQSGKTLKVFVGNKTGASAYSPVMGDYEGTLKNVKTDNTGRLLATIADPEDVMPSLSLGVTLNHTAAVLVPLAHALVAVPFVVRAVVVCAAGTGVGALMGTAATGLYSTRLQDGAGHWRAQCVLDV